MVKTTIFYMNQIRNGSLDKLKIFVDKKMTGTTLKLFYCIKKKKLVWTFAKPQTQAGSKHFTALLDGGKDMTKTF